MTHYNANANIFVYQMGKVGSVSIQVALREKGLHTLHGHWIQTEKGEYPTTKKALVNDIKIGKRKEGWKVITPIREPMARNISAFFQRIEQYYPKYRRYKYNKDVLDAFINTYNHNWPDLWFEKELMNVFEFDVYSEPFNYEKGYHIYKVKHGEVLIIRLEDAERVLSNAMEEFLGKENVRMFHSNSLQGRHKGTRVGKIYDEWREQAVFSEDFLDKIYSQKYVQHFYSSNEIQKFKEMYLG